MTPDARWVVLALQTAAEADGFWTTSRGDQLRIGIGEVWEAIKVRPDGGCISYGASGAHDPRITRWKKLAVAQVAEILAKKRPARTPQESRGP